MARPRGFSPRRGTRRATDWGFGTGGVAVTSISASGKAFVGAGYGLTTQNPVTLIRTRGEVEMFLKTGGTVGDGFRGAFGIAKASSVAFAAGIASLPGPISEINWDGWLYHRFFGVHIQDTTDFNGPATSLRFEIDSKAMRKLEVEDTVYAMLEVTEIGVATMDVFHDSRVLLKSG